MSENAGAQEARWRHRIAVGLGVVAALALGFMMLFTTGAVMLREFFDRPILGVVDVMELALVVCVFFAIAAVFFRDDHITVDIVDRVLPERFVRGLRLFAWLVAAGFIGASLYPMLPAALEKLYSAEVTMTLSIPRYIHWVPILLGFVFALAASLWLALVRPRQ
ncbi:MAG: TRAP transporter small permease [Burkholderiaceae bacterium]